MLPFDDSLLKSDLQNYMMLKEEITRLASKYAREYCHSDASADFEQVLLLYQVLILPDRSLEVYL